MKLASSRSRFGRGPSGGDDDPSGMAPVPPGGPHVHPLHAATGVGFGTSRTAGYIMHDGVAYMTCDLGFMWNRLEGQQRWILHLIYIFKRWHEDALEDGRARLRIDGKIYRTNFVKVEDAELNEILRGKLEDLGREYFAPAELGPPPDEPPNDVWFFRMDPST